MIHAAFLDIDGTLIDSNDAHAHAWEAILKQYKFNKPYIEIRNAIGMGGDNFLPALIGIPKESPLGEEMCMRRDELFRSHYLKTLRPFPGARDLLKKLKSSGVRLIVATSSNEQDVKALLEVAEANDLVENQVSSGDVKNSKPDPDIVQVALKKAKLPTTEVIMIGDTPYDIQAAEKAGVKTIAFRCGGWDDDALKNAIALYDHPLDLLQHLPTSPFQWNISR